MRRYLDRLAASYDRGYLETDPICFVHRYRRRDDREIAALLASALAFGNVPQIQRSLGLLFDRLAQIQGDDRPGACARAIDGRRHARALAGFRHRFVDGGDVLDLLLLVRRALDRHGTLGRLFAREFDRAGGAMRGALARFVRALLYEGRGRHRRPSPGLRHLLPDATLGSACKRLNLYLRWMVRRDAVDLGLWRGIPRSALVLPLDTHTSRISGYLGLTRRRTPGWSMAEEITANLRRLDPCDPVRYDFALSRLGILDRCPRRRDPVACRGCSIRRVCTLPEAGASRGEVPRSVRDSRS